jgi:hypothetical protein
MQRVGVSSGWTRNPKNPAVVTIAAPSANRKLAPVEMRANTTARLRPVPVGPYVAATMLPIAQTCSDLCAFKGSGCMATDGFTGGAVRKLEHAADGLTPLRIAEIEAEEIDRTWRATGSSIAGYGGVRKVKNGGVPQLGGRDGRSGIDLRLHVAGDIRGVRAAWVLAGAAHRWQARGGGSVWTFSHSWRDIPRKDWGVISVLASIEDSRDAQEARDGGYAPALVVDHFPDGDRTFARAGTRWVPCPAETRGATCISCRLCLDRTDWLRDSNHGIAFQAHGPGAAKARRKLPVVS